VRRIEVVRAAELRKGDSTPGIVRHKAFEADDVLFARSTIAGGVVSGWHHHGKRHLYGFLVSGRLRFDYGENGNEAIEVRPGDYFHILVGVIHRDVNPDPARKAVVVNILLGKGASVVNLPKP
jgi:uncharacterized RmlC-like cupin family protein